MKRVTVSLEPFRIRIAGYPWMPGTVNGWFVFNGPLGRQLRAMASDEEGWDHVSVSLSPPYNEKSAPTWEEMEWIKRQFFEPEECAYQLHPPLDQYEDGSTAMRRTGRPMVHVLHLWRCQSVPVPMPPREFI